jgi:truncated hemoglobin YjbI
MSETDETLHEHAGGDEGLHRLEEIFYAKALADEVLGEAVGQSPRQSSSTLLLLSA